MVALAAERHPLRAHDDALVARLAELPYATRLSFHLALDDPLLARFNGAQVGTVMDSLQLAPDTPLSQGILSQSIRQAQQERARAATGDGAADLPRPGTPPSAAAKA
jgi:preprotein translocase subunit SecA